MSNQWIKYETDPEYHNIAQQMQKRYPPTNETGLIAYKGIVIASLDHKTLQFCTTDECTNFLEGDQEGPLPDMIVDDDSKRWKQFIIMAVLAMKRKEYRKSAMCCCLSLVEQNKDDGIC